MSGHDVIVVGAGVVGSALGFALGKQGRKVLVLERDLNEPDRIVGELMQPAGILRLRDLGLEGCTKGIDSPEVHGYAVFTQGKGIKLSYPRDKSGELQIGQSFHHGRFITKLRESLKTVDTVELRQGTVLSLIEGPDRVHGVVYKADNTEHEARAPLTIVCDGCFSNLRQTFTNEKPQATSSFVGVIIKSPLPYPKHGHVFLLEPGPVLAYQIGTNEARMLIDIPHPLPSAANGELVNFLLEQTGPQLPESMRAAFEEAVRTTKPRSMANNHLYPHSTLRNGVFVMGDAFNMRHPLTGGGMTVGLSDVVLTRDLLSHVKDFSDCTAVTKQLGQFYNKRKGYAATINVLAGALYKVFAASSDPLLPHMREACMAYFKMGGICVSGPVALLSGLNPHPLSLMFHFFSVALFGVMRMLWPFPTPRKILNAYRLLSAASDIVVPLVRGEGVLPFLPLICRFLRLHKSTSIKTK